MVWGGKYGPGSGVARHAHLMGERMVLRHDTPECVVTRKGSDSCT